MDLAKSSLEGKMERLNIAVQTVRDQASPLETQNLLDFCLKLIAADGKIEPSELQLFVILCTSWGIDAKKFIQEVIQ